MATTPVNHDVADIGLAEAGQARIEWADAQMPVLASIRERFEREKPLDGITVGACLHVTTETANLVRTLMAGGADVGPCAPKPPPTQEEKAAPPLDRYGAEGFSIPGEGHDTSHPHNQHGFRKRPQRTHEQ